MAHVSRMSNGHPLSLALSDDSVTGAAPEITPKTWMHLKASYVCPRQPGLTKNPHSKRSATYPPQSASMFNIHTAKTSCPQPKTYQQTGHREVEDIDSHHQSTAHHLSRLVTTHSSALVYSAVGGVPCTSNAPFSHVQVFCPKFGPGIAGIARRVLRAGTL